MKKTYSYITLFFCLFISITHLAAQESVELFPAKSDQWKQAGPGSFSIKNGIATSQGGMGLWWYAGKSFKNATFDIEFRLPDPKFNSGIFIRFPNPKNDPWIAVRQGYECQLSGAGSGKQDTGGIYDIQAPSHNTLKKAEAWNQYQITTVENYILIVINGELVNVFQAQKGRGESEGHIGLQNHDPVSKVDYRKVSVREWDDKATLDDVLKKLNLTRADWAAHRSKITVNKKEKRWAAKADMGPAWANTFGDYYQGKLRVKTLKGLNLELSQPDQIRALFDTETLRLSSAHRGGVKWGGTPWTGSHGTKVTMANDQSSIMETSPLAGWANADGSFEDNRIHPGYGNFPADHMNYNGYYRYGAKVILDYSVHNSRVLEMFTGQHRHGQSMVYRQLDLAPSDHKRTMLVADSRGSMVSISEDGKTATLLGKAQVKNVPSAVKGKVSVVIDHTKEPWADLSMGAPSNSDSVDRKTNKKAYFRVLPEFIKTHTHGGDEEGVAVRLNDGLTSRNDNDLERNFFFKDDKKPGRLEMNLNGSKVINRIHLYSEHGKNRSGQDVTIYVTNDPFANATLPEKQLHKNGWKKLTSYKSKKSAKGGKYGVAILAPKGKSLGTMQKILFICKPPGGTKDHTFFGEIDIYENKAPVLKELASSSTAKSSNFVVHLKGKASFRDAGNGILALDIPASDQSTQATLGYTSIAGEVSASAKAQLKKLTPSPRELTSLTKGGAAIFPQTVTTTGKISNADTTWVTDQVGLPTGNPWLTNVRPGGFDFFSDGDSAALSTWEGDVWIVTGLKGDFKEFKWRRYASGLFETLGLKIVDDAVYVHGRDQLTRLHDQNNDGEADWYECFNNDVIITSNFHEFIFSLQTDKAGNFYFTKSAPVRPGGRGFDKILEHNGTVMRVSKDGKKLDVLATGLRAPGGMGVGPNGEITTGENEGSWQPACKLNYFTGKDKFLGTEPAAHHLKGQDRYLPLCYFPHSIDNSGGGQVWVPSAFDKTKWGLNPDELIHLSYGRSTLYRVLPQTVEGQIQGGVVRIPVNIKSSAMRARFHPDHSLYSLGFRGWQTNAATAQAFERIRFTGKKVNIPDQLRVTDKGVYIRFEHPLDPDSVKDRFNFNIEQWNYVRSSQYGSGKFSIDNPDVEAEKLALIQESKKHDKRDKVEIVSSQLLKDGKTIFLHIPTMKPADQLRIKYKLKFTDGQKAESEIMSTVHKLSAHTDNALIETGNVSGDAAEELKPGLAQTITSAESKDIRISRFAAQYVGEGDSVSDMLSSTGKSKKFTSVWSGYIVLDERVTPQFALQGNGAAVLKINGKEILRRSGKLDGKLSESIQLNPGKHKFELSYTSEDAGTAHVRTLWQTADTPLQSIAPMYFQYQPNKTILTALHTRAGRDIMQQQNCAACHTDKKSPLAKSSVDLSGIGSKVNQQWLTQWLASPHTVKPGTTMPAFVDASTDQGKKDAADMAAYLSSLKADTIKGAEPEVGIVKQGGHLFNQLGCVACHTLPGQKYDSKTKRIALNNVHQKYPLASLTDYLVDSKGRHPDFKLKGDESKQLANFLHQSSKGKATQLIVKKAQGDSARGEKLVVQHNCSGCHAGLPDGKSSSINLANILTKDWSNHGCASSDNKKSPTLNLTTEQASQLEIYRKHHLSLKGKNKLQGITSFHDFADRQQTQHNCTACHTRDAQPSKLSGLHQQSAHLSEGMKVDARQKVDQSRPQLTYIGEMLHTDYIAKMLAGSIQSPRPWLTMRMPAFHGNSDQFAKGLAAQHGMAPSKLEAEKLDAGKVKIGEKLIGSTGGFACNICHANGDTRALAAFEVEGINFAKVAQRLRPGYYHNWMENPQSIIPSTKMPRYTTGNKSPLPDHNNDAKQQFDSIHEYLKSINK